MYNLSVRPDIKFYDTEALLLDINNILHTDESFIISSITYDILVKDNNIALLDIIHNTERCEVIYIPLDDIMEYVVYANNILHPDEVIFVTGNRDYIDIANTFLGNEMIKFIG